MAYIVCFCIPTNNEGCIKFLEDNYLKSKKYVLRLLYSKYLSTSMGTSTALNVILYNIITSHDVFVLVSIKVVIFFRRFCSYPIYSAQHAPEFLLIFYFSFPRPFLRYFPHSISSIHPSSLVGRTFGCTQLCAVSSSLFTSFSWRTCIDP